MSAATARAYPCEGGCGTAMDAGLSVCDDCALKLSKTGVDSDSGSTEAENHPRSSTTNVDTVALTAASPQSSVVSRSSTEKKKRVKLPEVEWLLQEEAAGEIKPVWYPHPELPGWATEPMERLDDFYRKVRGLRGWAGDERPVLFTLDFIVKHTGLPKTTVHRALGQLVEAKVLVLAEKLPNGLLRPLHCYDPGPVKNVVPLHGIDGGANAGYLPLQPASTQHLPRRGRRPALLRLLEAPGQGGSVSRRDFSPLERRALLALLSLIRDREGEHEPRWWIGHDVPIKALYESMYVIDGDRSYEIQCRNQRQAIRRALGRLQEQGWISAVALAWCEVESGEWLGWQGGGSKKLDGDSTPRWRVVGLTDAGIRIAVALERETS